MSLSGKEISLAYYVKKVNERLGKSKDIVESVADNASDLALKVRDALFEAGIDLAEMIQLSLMSKENLRSADEKVPKSTTPVMVDRSRKQISPEILGWSIAILASAWTEWVFTSKTYNPRYQNDPEYANKADRQAAAQNVRLVLPYIYCSIVDSMDKARQ